MKKYKLICRSCGYELTSDGYRCPQCGGILRTVYELSDRERLRKALLDAKSFWDYIDFFPVEEGTEIISLGEGNTPLTEASILADRLGIKKLLLKNEGCNPSGTFKDRCMSISFTKARELHAKGVVIGSAGNAGAAAAAYGARSGLPCNVMLPSDSLDTRKALIQHYGARLIPVEGSVTDCIDLISEVYEEFGWHNVTTAAAYNPFQADAEKAIAYEMAKAMDLKVPDWIIVPIGGGGILTGIYQGYKDLLELGLIDHLPRMIGAQEAGCAPLVNAFREGRDPKDIERVKDPHGVAAAIADAFPLDGETALRAIYESKGLAETAEDQEILEAQSELGRYEGIFAETASAATVAVLKKLLKDGRISPEESVACIISGNGVKELPMLAEGMSFPPSVKNDVDALRSRLSSES